MKLYPIKNWLKNYTNQLLENLRKGKYTHLLQNIWGADLADMRLISKFNEGFKFLLCVIDIYSKYPWVATKIKKALQLLMLFKKPQMNLIAKQIKYGYVKAVKFIIDQ